jgi:aspartate/methionine/tyrosine aminotransferase
MSGAPKNLPRSLAVRVAGLPDISDPPLEGDRVAEGIMRAAFAALDAGETHYTDRPGILPLREHAVAQMGRRYGVEIGADAVTITCGAIEARFVAIKQLVPSARKIVCVDSTPIVGAAALCGVAITTDISDPAIALAYLSAADDPARVTAIADAANAADWWVIWDMSRDQGGSFHPAQHPNLASRTITIDEPQTMAGWRVGWMAGSKAANKLRAYKQSMTICTTSISQWAALGGDEV